MFVEIAVTTWPEPPELSSANAAVLNSFICLFVSNSNALSAVAVPGAWSSKDVKYLPPIRSTELATPPLSAPVPIYNLSPLFDCVPVT